MYKTKHFVTGNFISHASFVDDATYSVLLDNVVKATCDVFLVHERARVPQLASQKEPHILLCRRVGLPHNDWWIPGGRMLPGEQAAVAAHRLLLRELELNLMSGCQPAAAEEEPRAGLIDRVSTVAHFTFVWDQRTQEPVENGTCDVSLILEVVISDHEAEMIRCNPREYSAIEWVPLRDLVGEISGVENSVQRESKVPIASKLHPALRAGILELDAKFKWESVRRAMMRATERASLAEKDAVIDALRDFMKAKGECC